jgi:hypothetical protein
MLETYKRKFLRAIDDKDFVNSISEYISESGICPEHVCRYCKGRPCKDDEGFYDIDECPSNQKEILGNWFVLPKSAWNPPCIGKDCEILIICFVSAVRELFYDTHGRIWYPDALRRSNNTICGNNQDMTLLVHRTSEKETTIYPNFRAT